MKKLALLMLAILILGCDTETPVVEKPLPVVAQEAYFIDIEPPLMTSASVIDGEPDVDPVPLNQAGFRYDFDRKLKLYRVDLRLKDGESLGWHPHGVVDHENIGQLVEIVPVAESQLLKFDTEYVIAMFVQDHECYYSNFQIRFRTKPH